MELEVTEDFEYAIGSDLFKRIIYFCIPQNLVIDNKVITKKCGLMDVDRYIMKGIGWESILFSLCDISMHLPIMFDDLGFSSPDLHSFIYECL